MSKFTDRIRRAEQIRREGGPRVDMLREKASAQIDQSWKALRDRLTETPEAIMALMHLCHPPETDEEVETSHRRLDAASPELRTLLLAVGWMALMRMAQEMKELTDAE